MTLEFDNYISDEELEAASEFYDDLELDYDLDEIELDADVLLSKVEALEEEVRQADAEWDEHWSNFDMDLLDADGEFQTE